MDARQSALKQWVQEQCGTNGEWSLVSGDASFRRYFRWRTATQSFIAVDAPPEKENVSRFVQLANALGAQQVAVTEVLAHEANAGYMLQEDLGDHMLLPLLNDDTVDQCYRQAMQALMRWQAVKSLPLELEHYRDGRLHTELSFLPEWFLDVHLRMPLSEVERDMYTQQCALLLASAAEQPEVLTHRDYHSRNLMCVDETLRIIDFQDAVWGPITYDVVSLLKDCYIHWPVEHVRRWALWFRDHLVHEQRLTAVSDAQWLKWFDWMGLQRHLKVLGIFARLAHRDGKLGYLKDLPLTLQYCLETTANYHELKPMHDWLSGRVLPRMRETLS